MKLIVGLGNPENNYKDTRHNLGFMAVDHFVAKHKWPAFEHIPELVSFISEQNEVLVVKPVTYMNKSGQAVQKLVNAHNLAAEDILVVYDDVDLGFGTIRIRRGESSGGHNGVESVITVIGHSFWRLRLGVANDAIENSDTADFVLSDFTKTEQKELPFILETASDQIARFVSGQQREETLKSNG